jgi:signal transduction histidine kinase/CheY-like chemotaxis protein
MFTWAKKIVHAIAVFFHWDALDHELMQSISRKVMGTTIATYLVWHIVATLGWPQYFSPKIYLISLLMVVTATVASVLLSRFYFLSQMAWFVGLTAVIITSFALFQNPAILFCLAFLPIMAEVMLGMRPTILLDLILFILVWIWSKVPGWIPFPENYLGIIIVTTGASTALGWGIMDNLLSSIEAASYHYREAVQRLNEAREHRAEISVLLKDVNRANYQLENLNRMLIYARAQADEAREERDRFALAVSHELRSPLNFIIGFSDLMVNSPETYAKITNWPHGLYDDIREIYKSSTHLMSLINDILDMGKMDAQQMVLFKEKIDFAVVIEDVRQMVHSAVESKGLDLKINVQPDLPMIYVDRTRMRQVLLNLVTNSLRFTRKGSITIHAFMENPEILRVEVIDTGVGISKADQPKVFKEFRQVGNQNWQRGEGSGLGLSIGRRFIQMHGGEMGLESEQGKGSTFYFVLPIQQQVDALENLGQIDDSEEQGRHKLLVDEKLPTLLFLSRDAFSARVFAESMQGIKATLMTDPEQLFSAVASTYPRSVIIDEPLLNNDYVKNFIKAPPYDVPIFVISIPLSRHDRNSNLPAGVNDYLVKPVPRQVMIETIAKLKIEPHTVLVVDDDPSMSRFVTQSLKTNEEDFIQLPADLNIVTALDGQEAMRFLQALPVGVVLLDLDLSDMNGLTLLNHMRQDSKLSQIPVVIISASDPPPTFETEKKGEFRVFVNRSLSGKELTDMLNASLHQVLPNFTLSPQKISEAESTDEYSDSDE